ncbi:hypothetical protein NKH18_17865 [Streptomyces sp. M10(2022)]
MGARGGNNTDGVTRIGDSLDDGLGDIGRAGDALPGGAAADRTQGGTADNMPSNIVSDGNVGDYVRGNRPEIPGTGSAAGPDLPPFRSRQR